MNTVCSCSCFFSSGECKFTLQTRKGCVVRIHDGVLMAESRYKCLLVSEGTTAEEVRQDGGLEMELCCSCSWFCEEFDFFAEIFFKKQLLKGTHVFFQKTEETPGSFAKNDND